MNLSEEDPLPKSVMTTLRRYRKPVAEMPNNPDHDSNERKEIENSGSRFTFSKSYASQKDTNLPINLFVDFFICKTSKSIPYPDF